MARLTEEEVQDLQSDKPDQTIEYQGFLNSEVKTKSNILDKIDSELNDLVKAYKVTKLTELLEDSEDLATCEGEILAIQSEALLLGLKLDLSALKGSSGTSKDPRRHLNFTTKQAAEWLVDEHESNVGLTSAEVLAKWELKLGKPQTHPDSWMNFFSLSQSDKIARLDMFKAKE